MTWWLMQRVGSIRLGVRKAKLRIRTRNLVEDDSQSAAVPVTHPAGNSVAVGCCTYLVAPHGDVAHAHVLVSACLLLKALEIVVHAFHRVPLVRRVLKRQALWRAAFAPCAHVLEDGWHGGGCIVTL